MSLMFSASRRYIPWLSLIAKSLAWSDSSIAVETLLRSLSAERQAPVLGDVPGERLEADHRHREVELHEALAPGSATGSTASTCVPATNAAQAETAITKIDMDAAVIPKRQIAIKATRIGTR